MNRIIPYKDHNIVLNFAKARLKGQNPNPKHSIAARIDAGTFSRTELTTSEITPAKVEEIIQAAKDEVDNRIFPANLKAALIAAGFTE